MIEVLVVLVAGLVVIAAATVAGPRLAVLDVQRSALLDARDNDTFDADVLAVAPGNLDASQIAIDTRGRLAE